MRAARMRQAACVQPAAAPLTRRLRRGAGSSRSSGLSSRPSTARPVTLAPRPPPASSAWAAATGNPGTTGAASPAAETAMVPTT
ncbi:hypothetical protein [Streptomyces europaeiscabiei]|uniref:hypothetical protein n=1 Tax=Streptomyces europaeiscabiei TaxID=146819 RepID=UPI002E298DF2|nr:hypothetical protein [Streptomyces europaeiscabiei]